MQYTLNRLVDAVQEPVSARELSDHLRLDASNAEPTPAAPTATLMAPPAAGNIDTGAHRYLVTFVTADGETSAGSASEAITIANPAVNGRVTLSDIPIGGGAVTARRLYRTTAGGAVYYRLDTLNDNTTTTYVDNKSDAALGSAVPTTNTTLDPQLSRLIAASRRVVENYTRRALIQQTWQQRMRDFPSAGSPIRLMRPNALSVTAVQYLAADGTLTTLDAAEYEVELNALPAAVWEARGRTWPSAVYSDRFNSVTVEFLAGYGAARSAVPEPIRQAILIHAADLYAHRESFVTGTIVQGLEFTARHLLAPYVWKEVW